MAIDEKEAEIVKLIFSEVLLGKSPGLISKELNEKIYLQNEVRIGVAVLFME